MGVIILVSIILGLLLGRLISNFFLDWLRSQESQKS
jgi:uncharacterized membrane protein YwzB